MRMVECTWAVSVDDFGGVSAHPLVWVSVCGGMWWVCGAYGVVRCASLGIVRGMGVQFLSLLLFNLAFWSGVGCDFGGQGLFGVVFRLGRIAGLLIWKGGQ